MDADAAAPSFGATLDQVELANLEQVEAAAPSGDTPPTGHQLSFRPGRLLKEAAQRGSSQRLEPPSGVDESGVDGDEVNEGNRHILKQAASDENKSPENSDDEADENGDAADENSPAKGRRPQKVFQFDGAASAERPHQVRQEQQAPGARRFKTSGDSSGRNSLTKPPAPSNQHQQSYRQLAYFRGVHQVAGGARGGQPAQRQHNPDSVRDNFISPGHFPGSMSHLTQAASELVGAQKSAATSRTEPPVGAANSSSSSSTASSPPSPAEPTELAEPKPVGEKTSANEISAVVVPVTPFPEAQPESQQIMAPILVSTTTMAPLVAEDTQGASAGANSTENAPAPSLRRFKFRKYR